MDKNKEHYEKQYCQEIEYKYKTNTRYQRYLVECLEKYIDKESVKSVCDVGCGQGLNTVLFADDFFNAKILGIDLAEAGIKYAKNKYKDKQRCTFECANICDYDWGTNKFNLVTAFELLEHIEDWETVAKAICGVSDRYIMVSAPIGRMRSYEVNHGHYRNYQRGELETFFISNGFKCVKVYYAGFPFWSPITRDLLNFLPGDSTVAQENLSLVGKLASQILFFLFRYCSFKNKGDQFVGLFEKD